MFILDCSSLNEFDTSHVALYCMIVISLILYITLISPSIQTTSVWQLASATSIHHAFLSISTKLKHNSEIFTRTYPSFPLSWTVLIGFIWAKGIDYMFSNTYQCRASDHREDKTSLTSSKKGFTLPYPKEDISIQFGHDMIFSKWIEVPKQQWKPSLLPLPAYCLCSVSDFY